MKPWSGLIAQSKRGRLLASSPILRQKRRYWSLPTALIGWRELLLLQLWPGDGNWPGKTNLRASDAILPRPAALARFRAPERRHRPSQPLTPRTTARQR